MDHEGGKKLHHESRGKKGKSAGDLGKKIGAQLQWTARYQDGKKRSKLSKVVNLRALTQETAFCRELKLCKEERNQMTIGEVRLRKNEPAQEWTVPTMREQARVAEEKQQFPRPLHKERKTERQPAPARSKKKKEWRTKNSGKNQNGKTQTTTRERERCSSSRRWLHEKGGGGE